MTGVALSVLLSGCAAIPGLGPKPLDTYDLTTPPVQKTGRRGGRTQVLIAEPSALKSLDGQSIVIKPGAGTLQFLQGAQWSDRLPRIVQARLTEAFQETGRFSGVGKPGEGLAIDYQVVSDIRAFDIHVDDPSVAEIEIYVRILNDRNGVVRDSRTFKTEVPVNGAGNDALVAALDRAFGAITVDIVKWSVARM